METDTRVSRGSPFFTRWFWLAIAIACISLLIRLAWYPVITTDYTYFVKAWADTLGAHRGLSAFASPFADYAPLYLYALKFLALLPVPILVSAKTLSFLFDIAIGVGVFLILGYFSRFAQRLDLRVLAAVVVASLPTVMMNSSLWGQSDSLYATGVIFSFLFVLVDAPFAAALAFGLALSMKMQAIFFAPVLAGYLLRERAHLKYLLVPLGVFLVSVIPAWMAGGDPRYWFLIYAHQAGEYPYLSVSAQSLFAFLQPLGLSIEAATSAFWIGIALAGLIAISLALLVALLRTPDPRLMTLITTASVLFLPYVLPRMHERYFYLADICAVLYAFMRRGRALVPITVVLASLLSYMPFLSQQVPFLAPFNIDLRLPALLLLLPIGILVRDLIAAVRALYYPRLSNARAPA